LIPGECLYSRDRGVANSIPVEEKKATKKYRGRDKCKNWPTPQEREKNEAIPVRERGGKGLQSKKCGYPTPRKKKKETPRSPSAARTPQGNFCSKEGKSLPKERKKRKENKRKLRPEQLNCCEGGGKK